MSTVLMSFHPGQVEEVIEMLKYINVDGETMEYIVEKVHMKEQMLRQLIMSSPVKDVRELFEEKMSIIK